MRDLLQLDEIDQIKQLLIDGDLTQDQIGAKFNVHQTTISRLKMTTVSAASRVAAEAALDVGLAVSTDDSISPSAVGAPWLLPKATSSNAAHKQRSQWARP